MKPFTYLFFSFLILIALSSYSQNDSATIIKSSAKDTSSSGEQNITSVSKFNAVGKVSRPFYINTVISRNDSIAENRVVKVLGDDLSANGFLFEVKNRWGNSIYECQSLIQMTTTGWDGKKEEEFISPGLYSFTVRYQYINGEAFQKVGFITIQ